MTKLYTVVRVGFEYDDTASFGHRSRGEYGDAILAYKSKKRAQDEVDSRNEGMYAEHSPQHCGQLYRITYDKLLSKYPALAEINYHELNNKWTTLSRKLRLAIWKECGAENFFYKLSEVEIADD